MDSDKHSFRGLIHKPHREENGLWPVAGSRQTPFNIPYIMGITITLNGVVNEKRVAGVVTEEDFFQDRDSVLAAAKS